MSVDKFIVSHEESGFTTLPNDVIQGLRNAEALGLWCYCASLPPNWIFHKSAIQEHLCVGRDKIDKLFKILEYTKLANIFQGRTKTGRFDPWYLHVLSGRDFRPLPVDKNTNKPLTDFQGAVSTRINTDVAPFPDLPFTDNQGLVNSSYKRNNTNKIKIYKNEKKSSFVQNQKIKNSKQHSFAQSMNYMANEKRHIEEHEQRKKIEMSVRRNGTVKLAKEILEK